VWGRQANPDSLNTVYATNKVKKPKLISFQVPEHAPVESSAGQRAMKDLYRAQ